MDAQLGRVNAIGLPLKESPMLAGALADAIAFARLENAGYAYIVDVGALQFAQYRGDADVYPASVIKIAIMAEAFHQYAQGMLRPDATFSIAASNLTTTAEKTPFTPGHVAPVAQMVELMITHSDNIATNQLIDVLRRERVTDYMRSLALDSFLLGRKLSGSDPLVADPEMIGRNRMPPSQAARLLAFIATDQIAGAAQARAILGRCVDDEKLAAGLSPSDRFMHKTGETSDVNHDAGILETSAGKMYVLALYTQIHPESDRPASSFGNQAMSTWMRRLREAL